MKRLLLGFALAVMAGTFGAGAQAYPSRPVTVIVPFAAGGATDVLARFLGERMRAILGQPLIVENVTGAGGSIGVTRLVRASADGYTIEIGTSTGFRESLLEKVPQLMGPEFATVTGLVLYGDRRRKTYDFHDNSNSGLKKFVAKLRSFL